MQEIDTVENKGKANGDVTERRYEDEARYVIISVRVEGADGPKGETTASRAEETILLRSDELRRTSETRSLT